MCDAQPEEQAPGSSAIADMLASPLAKAVLAGIAAMVKYDGLTFCRALKDDGWPRPAELSASDLAAEYGRAFTGWADAFHPPTLARVAGTGSDAPATKVARNVSLQSPVSPPGGNALGCAVCCGRHD